MNICMHNTRRILARWLKRIQTAVAIATIELAKTIYNVKGDAVLMATQEQFSEA
jgi:hypothetical protein